MARPRSKRQKAPNVAKVRADSIIQAKEAANLQIFLREFNPDFDQILLRLSTEATQGLKSGSPPGGVGH